MEQAMTMMIIFSSIFSFGMNIMDNKVKGSYKIS